MKGKAPWLREGKRDGYQGALRGKAEASQLPRAEGGQNEPGVGRAGGRGRVEGGIEGERLRSE